MRRKRPPLYYTQDGCIRFSVAEWMNMPGVVKPVESLPRSRYVHLDTKEVNYWLGDQDVEFTRGEKDQTLCGIFPSGGPYKGFFTMPRGNRDLELVGPRRTWPACGDQGNQR